MEADLRPTEFGECDSYLYPIPDRKIRITACRKNFDLASYIVLEKRPLLQAMIRAWPRVFGEGGVVTTWGVFVTKIASEAGSTLGATEKGLLEVQETLGLLEQTPHHQHCHNDRQL